MDDFIRQKLNSSKDDCVYTISRGDSVAQAAAKSTTRVVTGERLSMADILTEQAKERKPPAFEEQMATYNQSGVYDKEREPENNCGKWQVCSGDLTSQEANSLDHVPIPPKEANGSGPKRDNTDYAPDCLAPGEQDGVGVEDGDVIHNKLASPARQAVASENIESNFSTIYHRRKSGISDRVLTVLTREQQIAKELGEGDDAVFYPPGGKHPPRSPPKTLEPVINRPKDTGNQAKAATATLTAAKTITTAQVQALGSSAHIRAQSSGSGFQFTPIPTQPRSMNLNQFAQNNAFQASPQFAMYSPENPADPRQPGNPNFIQGAGNLHPGYQEFSSDPFLDTTSRSDPANLLRLLSIARPCGVIGPDDLAAKTALDARIASSKFIADKSIESAVEKAKFNRDEFLFQNNLSRGGSFTPNNPTCGYHARTLSSGAVAGMGSGNVGSGHNWGSTGDNSNTFLSRNFGAASFGGNSDGMGILSGPLTNSYHNKASNWNLSHQHPAPGSYQHPPKNRSRRLGNSGRLGGSYIAKHSFDSTTHTGQVMNRPAAPGSSNRRVAPVASQHAAHSSITGTTHGRGIMNFGHDQTHDFKFPGCAVNDQN